MGAAATFSNEDSTWMDLALRLARRGYGTTSPNPMVGAVLVKAGKSVGQGWHRRAGDAHAEIEAIRDAGLRGNSVSGATLYVTLEPCSTHGRTPPCTEAILASSIARVVVGATDPNPQHAGRGYDLLRKGGLEVVHGVRVGQANRLNEAFNHWIVERTPFVIVKAALSLDGKIATRTGESKWITGPAARAAGMKLRQGADAILVGINTVLRDDPQLTVRRGQVELNKRLRRVVLDGRARTPLSARVLSNGHRDLTTVVTSERASQKRIAQLRNQVDVVVAPERDGRIDLAWLLTRLGSESVTSLLIEGGGEVNASFLLGGFAHRIAFFYAPKIIGGRTSADAVAGAGVENLADALTLTEVRWQRVGVDFLLTARVSRPHAA